MPEPIKLLPWRAGNSARRPADEQIAVSNSKQNPKGPLSSTSFMWKGDVNSLLSQLGKQRLGARRWSAWCSWDHNPGIFSIKNLCLPQQDLRSSCRAPRGYFCKAPSSGPAWLFPDTELKLPAEKINNMLWICLAGCWVAFLPCHWDVAIKEIRHGAWGTVRGPRHFVSCHLTLSGWVWCRGELW